jgi:hypothetical protein
VRPKPAVLIVAHAFPPENVVGALRPFRFAKYLKRLGYPVSVLTASPQRTVQHPFPVHIPPDRIMLWENILRKTVLPGAFGLSWVTAGVRFANQVLSRTPISIFFSTYPPTSAHLAGLWLKRRHGLRWIADFRDPPIDNPLQNGRRAQFGDPLLERVIFRDADARIAKTDALAER